jgi:hypothetical protein
MPAMNCETTLTEAKNNMGNGLGGAVKLVVRFFLEPSHNRQLIRILSEHWSDTHSLTAAVKLMESHGVTLSPEEEKRIKALPEERMIDALVARMPQQTREQFEHFFLQLSLIASTSTRLRSALDAGDPAVAEEVLESADNVGILGYLLKMVVAQAGGEVRTKEAEHDKWMADTDARMAPLLQSQAQALVAQKALANAKSTLSAYRVDANEKSKKVLLGLVGNRDAALVGISFGGWKEILLKAKREAEVRKEYEEELNKSFQALAACKEKQIANIRSVLARNTDLNKMKMIEAVYSAMKQEVADFKQDEQVKAEAAALEEKLRGFSDAAAKNAKSVLARMNGNNAETLKANAFSAWSTAIAEEKHQREMEDKVKEAEKRFADFQSRQKSGAKGVLAGMQGASEAGLIKMMFDAWKEAVQEEKNAILLQEQMAEKAAAMNQFGAKGKMSAKSEMERMQCTLDTVLLLMIFSSWKRDAKLDRMKRYGQAKNQQRKQQLVNVKGLFKNFAGELENGLKEGTPRVDLKAVKSK